MSFWWAIVMPGGALGTSDDGNRPTSSDSPGNRPAARSARCGRPGLPWYAAATDEGVTDSAGAAGPAYQVRPRVVFGWDVDMRAPTRWSFTDSTTSLTP